MNEKSSVFSRQLTFWTVHGIWIAAPAGMIALQTSSPWEAVGIFLATAMFIICIAWYCSQVPTFRDRNGKYWRALTLAVKTRSTLAGLSLVIVLLRLHPFSPDVWRGFFAIEIAGGYDGMGKTFLVTTLMGVFTCLEILFLYAVSLWMISIFCDPANARPPHDCANRSHHVIRKWEGFWYLFLFIILHIAFAPVLYIQGSLIAIKPVSALFLDLRENGFDLIGFWIVTQITVYLMIFSFVGFLLVAIVCLPPRRKQRILLMLLILTPSVLSTKMRIFTYWCPDGRGGVYTFWEAVDRYQETGSAFRHADFSERPHARRKIRYPN